MSECLRHTHIMVELSKLLCVLASNVSHGVCIVVQVALRRTREQVSGEDDDVAVAVVCLANG